MRRKLSTYTDMFEVIVRVGVEEEFEPSEAPEHHAWKQRSTPVALRTVTREKILGRVVQHRRMNDSADSS